MADTTNGNDIFTRKIKINISEADCLSIGISGENTENNLCFIFIHGAGSSKYTWHFQISRFKHFFLTVALDWRGHGESSDFSSNSTMKNIVEDIDKALLCLREIISNRSVVLVGHSIGGAIATYLSSASCIQESICAVIVIDLAEEPAIQSLQHMETIISTWPKHFTTIEECIHWSVRERRPKSLWAAEMSIPSLLLQPDPTGPYVWRTDLLSYSCYWRDWFTGFDEAFIKIKQPHCLILSCVDRLDPALTVGHMQGKFEVQVVHGSDGSHFVQEDHTEEVVCIITNFLRARGIVTAKLATAVIRSSLSSSFSPSSLQAML